METGQNQDETNSLARGKGDVRDLVARRERTQHLACLEKAVYGGWDIPQEASRAAPDFLYSVVNDPNMDTRARIRAVEVLSALARDRVDAAVQLDRIYRLEAGEATDRMEVVTDMADAALEAVARSIAAIAPDTPTLRPPCQKPKRLPKPRD